MSQDATKKLEGLLEHVDASRRQTLKRLLLGTGVAVLVAPMTTLLADEQTGTPGDGRGKGKGKGKGKGDVPDPGQGRGKGKGKGTGKGRRGGGGAGA